MAKLASVNRLIRFLHRWAAKQIFRVRQDAVFPAGRPSFLTRGFEPMSFELPHWLMIAGALLVGAGFVGVLASGGKPDEVDAPPEEPIDLPALPILNSRKRQ